MKVIAWPAFKTRYKNPYGWLLYTQLQAQGIEVAEFSPGRLLVNHYDLLHLHWPIETLVRHPNPIVALMRVLLFWFVLEVTRLKGTKVVWTIHDEKPHVLMHSWLASRFQSILVRRVDAYVNLCEAGKQAIHRSIPSLDRLPSFTIPHGHYRDIYPNTLSKASARQQLGLAPEVPTLLFFGYISPYKNLPHLIEVFQQLSDSEVRLVVAGKPDSDEMAAQIQQLAADDPRIQLHLRFIPDDELQIFFNAADLAVLPFTAILNSGSLLLSLSFNRPVLVPALGALPEWQALVGADWVQTYKSDLDAAALAVAIATIRQRALPAIAPIDDLDWSRIGQQTATAYRQLCGHAREPQTV
ncbi:MAG: glycosyltransferase [Cyanobacteria bacterium P01_D01_bin.14]